MSVSTTRFPKSETRSLADSDRAGMNAWNQPVEWAMKGSNFFTAFVSIAVALAALALILRYAR